MIHTLWSLFYSLPLPFPPNPPSPRISFSPSQSDSSLLSGMLYEFSSKGRGNPGQELNHSSDRRACEQWHGIFPAAVQCSSAIVLHHGNGKTFQAPRSTQSALMRPTCGNRAGNLAPRITLLARHLEDTRIFPPRTRGSDEKWGSTLHQKFVRYESHVSGREASCSRRHDESLEIYRRNVMLQINVCRTLLQHASNATE